MASSAARRYTQAISELAQENGTFDVWQRDLHAMKALVSDPEVENYLQNPAVQDARKLGAIDSVVTDMQPEALRLLHMLIEGRRLNLVTDIAELFDEEVLAHNGVVLVDVTTADALDDAGKELVRERLKSIVGKDVELRLHVDAGIIGGIVARIGDQVIDGSVVTQLRRLRAQMNAV
jgi:F-type H+-transporting ATPase subunit delta